MINQTGIYGRPDIRSDGATLLSVQCKSGDSDCQFPNCSCPNRATAEDRKEFVEGKKVRHFLFGDGVIQGSKPSHGRFGLGGISVEVRFEGGDVKTIEATELPLDKFHVVEA